MSICFKKISAAYAPFAAARVAHLPGTDRAVRPHQAVKQGFVLSVNFEMYFTFRRTNVKYEYD